MTATAPCPRCGAQNAVDARQCDACGVALAEPTGPEAEEVGRDDRAGESRQALELRAAATRVDWRRVTAAVAATLLISAAGALAIYAVHRSMPAVPPGFERIARTSPAPPPPESGDDARLRHLRRPEPGAGIVAAQPAPAAVQPDSRSARAATVASVAAAPPAPVPAPVPAPAQPSGPQPAPAAAASARPQLQARSGERLAPLQATQCGGQSLLARVVCNERVRLRFCRDRWNDHPDCEAAKPPNQVQ